MCVHCWGLNPGPYVQLSSTTVTQAGLELKCLAETGLLTLEILRPPLPEPWDQGHTQLACYTLESILCQGYWNYSLYKPLKKSKIMFARTQTHKVSKCNFKNYGTLNFRYVSALDNPGKIVEKLLFLAMRFLHSQHRIYSKEKSWGY